MTLSIQADRSLVRSTGGSVRYVLASIQAPECSEQRAPLPLNIALVIDRSGSMSGDKIRHARDAARYAVSVLRPIDRFAIVCYDDQVDILVPSTQATPEACHQAVMAIDRLTARANTDLGAGWLSGCQQVAEYLSGESLNRALLLTDGLANQGITDQATLCHHATELRVRGIVTSTFGIGEDFDEVLLSAIADAGGGNFRLIRNAEEIPHLLRQELWEGLSVVAAETVLEIGTPPGVKVESLNDFPLSQPESGVSHIRLGDLVSEQMIEPVVLLRFPEGSTGSSANIQIRVLDKNGTLGRVEQSMAFQYADHGDNDRQLRNVIVDRRVASLYAARARREALFANRSGDYAKAGQIIAACRKRIETYVGTDPELRALVIGLEETQISFSTFMDSMSRKHIYSSSSAYIKERLVSGSARHSSLRFSLVIVPNSETTEAACRTALCALLESPHKHLFGELRLSTGWRTWLADNPPVSRLTSLQEIKLVDSAEHAWYRDGMRLVLTGAQLANNWYSHWHPSGRTSLVSLFEFDQRVSVPLTAFIAYEILLHGLHNRHPRYDHEALLHTDTLGCVFDLNPDKRDIEIKLQNLHVCPKCRQKLPAMDVDPEQVESLADIVRAMAYPGASSVRKERTGLFSSLLNKRPFGHTR